MFNYVGNITDLAHHIVKNFCRSFDTAIDATLGNGYDTDFLLQYFKKVYSFDIQKDAVDNYSRKFEDADHLILINGSHEYFDRYITDTVDCIMYNLGFLPGGDKSITTKSQSTIESMKKGIELLKSGGLITIAIYNGHPEGKNEEKELHSFMSTLPKNKYGVLLHSYLNRDNTAPALAVIEKK
jgi:Putative rRNA methylase.